MKNRFKQLEQLEEQIISSFNSLINCKLDNYTLYLYDGWNEKLYNIENLSFKIIRNDETKHLELHLPDEKGWRDIKIDLRKMVVDDWCLKYKANSYFDTNKKRKLPKEIRRAIEEYREYWKFQENPNKDEIEQQELQNIRAYAYDENGRKVTKQMWLALAEVADTPRVKGESRAVFIDNQLVCNASAAIECLEIFEDYRNGNRKIDPRKLGDKLYAACESDRYFQGSFVCYASEEEIRAYAENIQE